MKDIKNILKLVYRYLPFYNFYKNIYHTKYKKDVLISYITYPIRKGVLKTHQNILELQCLCEVFKSLGFNVDVVNYTYRGKIDYSKYDIIFGFGYPFGKSLTDKSSSKALKIAYLTGSLKLFNQMERIRYLKERKGVVVVPRRNYYWEYLQETISMSDAIIVTGNDWTCSTVKPYNMNVFSVRLPIFLPTKDKILELIEKKDFEKIRKTFLWFGSSGAVHKGLDLCLDVFSKNQELFLHVCGPVDKEEDFWNLYKKELIRLKNIRYHGFVSIESNMFEEIINSTAFAIFPSCSEGTSGSLLTCMAYGLIPVATKEAGVNIEKNYGLLLEDYKIEYIENKIFEINKTPPDKLKDMAIQSMDYTHKNHSAESYKSDILNILRRLGV